MLNDKDFFVFKVTDIGKRGWSNLSGSNYTSTAEQCAGYGDFSQNSSSYQRSHSVTGNITSGMGNQSNSNDNDWGWQDSPKRQMPTSKSFNNQFNDSNRVASSCNTFNNDDDDWSGFDSYQDSANSYQNSTPLTAPANSVITNKNLKLASTTQKLSEGFDSLDVKSSNSEHIGNKKAEDDAWNLLMN